MTENKVVIKFNYDPGKPREFTPEIVTEWRLGRIVMAVLVVIILLGLFVYLMMGNDTEKARKKESMTQAPRPESTLKTAEQTSVQPNQPPVEDLPDKQVVEKKVNRVNETDESVTMLAFPVIYDTRISRAVLTADLNKKEPGDPIELPITTDKTKAVGVYFFTEINSMKGNVLYHQWFKNDKLVFKRKINILGNRWRASTSKLLSFSSKGEWYVSLVDDSGHIFSEIKFKVI